jgi:hypothetical protein
MKTPAATDSIARTPSPNATSDPIAVPPKVPACDAAPPTSAYGAPPAVPAPKAP